MNETATSTAADATNLLDNACDKGRSFAEEASAGELNRLMHRYQHRSVSPPDTGSCCADDVYAAMLAEDDRDREQERGEIRENSIEFWNSLDVDWDEIAQNGEWLDEFVTAAMESHGVRRTT